jgi:hypothetical protein
MWVFEPKRGCGLCLRKCACWPCVRVCACVRAWGHRQKLSFDGTYWTHPRLRVAHVSQHSIEVLGAASGVTALQYFVDRFAVSVELKARAHLGSFGLGDAALQLVGSLSGGQKARVSASPTTVALPGFFPARVLPASCVKPP